MKYGCVVGDVDGSVEAILEVLDSYESDQCRLHVMSYGVGPITDQDVDMASNFDGKSKTDPYIRFLF